MSGAVEEELSWSFMRAVDLYRSGANIRTLGPLLVQAKDELEAVTEMAVADAIGRETWETIGASLGVSRQAARKKYGPVRA
ncbi:MAG: hypothetical protein JWP11_2214 [Frankiales bacterium]|nr:hypothetical protein [Frankiales bacterium]